MDIAHIHEKLDEFASFYCPVIKHFPMGYHWSVMQVEYATDIIFKRQKDLRLIYDNLTPVLLFIQSNRKTSPPFLAKNYHPYIKMKWVIISLQE